MRNTRTFTDPSHRQHDPRFLHRLPMRDDKTIRQRLEELRGQFLQCGTPDLQVFAITKDELRGSIRAIEWVLGSQTFREPSSTEPGTHSGNPGERQNPCRRSPRPE